MLSDLTNGESCGMTPVTLRLYNSCRAIVGKSAVGNKHAGTVVHIHCSLYKVAGVREVFIYIT